jgi:CRISPR/Cas system CSM-associated protein Csm3 (group 7 of RAMP superfamily)
MSPATVAYNCLPHDERDVFAAKHENSVPDDRRVRSNVYSTTICVENSAFEHEHSYYVEIGGITILKLFLDVDVVKIDEP